jgi:hypothetical protein
MPDAVVGCVDRIPVGHCFSFPAPALFVRRHGGSLLGRGRLNATESESAEKERIVHQKARQVLVVWVAFFAATLSFNLLIPLALGFDLHEWTYSTAKGLLLFSVDYAGFFVVVPLVLVKGWRTVRKPAFLIPMLAAAVSVVLWYPIHYIATIAIVVYVYLHWRYDLGELGFRSRGLVGDSAGVLLLGALGLLQGTVSGALAQIAVLPALTSTVFRMFGNPASTVENLFYFGFITDRLGNRFNRYLVPFLIGAMYTAHEISNPEYWYEGTSFVFIFIGVTVMAALYLWRRSVVVVWLADGLSWFLARL